jgi:hypothetical protein
MEALAMVRPVSPERIDRLLEREASWAVPFGATIVIVSAVMSPDLIEVAERLSAKGHPVRAIYVGWDDAPEGTTHVPIESMGNRFDLPLPPPPRASIGDTFADDFDDDHQRDAELERGEASFERWRI